MHHHHQDHWQNRTPPEYLFDAAALPTCFNPTPILGRLHIYAFLLTYILFLYPPRLQIFHLAYKPNQMLFSLGPKALKKNENLIFSLLTLVVCQRDQRGNGKVTTELCQVVWLKLEKSIGIFIAAQLIELEFIAL